MKHPRILWLAGLLSVALAGCGVTSTPETVAQPGAGTPATPNPQPAPTVTSASLRITIPVLLSSAGDLISQYVSAGTRSLTVSIDGSTPKVFNVGAGLGTCSGTGPFTCTLTIGQISPGPHTFSIAAYDAPNAGGHLLGNIGPVDATLSAGIDNALSFTLTGIVNGLKVQPSVSDAQDQPATGYWLLNTGAPRVSCQT